MQDEAEMSASGTLSILHVSQPTEGGVAGYVAEVVADQARRGRSVTVACPTWGALGATAVLCVSEAERRRGVEQGVRAEWRVIPIGVDLDAFPPASPDERSAARRRLELEERPTVVCVGRLCRQKGQDVLLDAWPRVV